MTSPEKFDPSKCGLCEEVNDCAAGRFASDVFEAHVREAAQDLTASAEQVGLALSAAFSPELAAARKTRLDQEYEALLRAGETAGTIVRNVVARAIDAQNLPNSLLSDPSSPQGRALEEIAYDHREAIGPERPLTPSQVDSIGVDVRFNAARGLCDAIDLPE